QDHRQLRTAHASSRSQPARTRALSLSRRTVARRFARSLEVKVVPVGRCICNRTCFFCAARRKGYSPEPRWLMGAEMAYRLNINGAVRQVDVPAEMPLLWVLRNELGLVGTKFGCGKGFCGACTVHVNGAAQRSCQLPVGSIGQAKIHTIEHIGET